MAGRFDFTVLLPVHGGDDARHFREAARSLAASTLAPSETLICRDGPLPGPLATAVDDAARALGARVIVNPGAPGLHHNLNHAARQVQTSWIARMDADDINLTERFALQAAAVRASPEVDVLGGAILEFSPQGRTRRRVTPTDHDDIVRHALWRNPMNHMTVVLRRETFLAAGGYPTVAKKEDYALWLELIGRGARFANLAQDLVKVRLGEDFGRRRAGIGNIASEYRLFQIKRRLPKIGGPVAAAAFAARAGALAFEGPAAVLYRYALR